MHLRANGLQGLRLFMGIVSLAIFFLYPALLHNAIDTKHWLTRPKVSQGTFCKNMHHHSCHVHIQYRRVIPAPVDWTSANA